jgi:choline dehydrogenase-like flavoprotein
MIIDARRLNEAGEIRASIAIIGAGAAGITLALELAERFQDVLLLESGGTHLEKETQDLYDGKLRGHPYQDLQLGRLRFLGGSTNHWMGQCPRLDPLRKLLEGSEFHLNGLALEGSGLQLTEFRYSPPTRFGERYLSLLSSSDRIMLYLNANVTDITTNDSRGAIRSLEVRTLNDRKLTVTAAAFILCCGGIENARILLNCTRQIASGLGNQHDLVGRFFMDHITASGTIVPQTEIYDLGAFDQNKSTMRHRVGLMNSGETVRQPGRRGCSLTMFPIQFAESAMRSRAYEAVQHIAQYAKRGSLAPDFGESACTALGEPRAIAQALYYRLRTRLGRVPVREIIVAMEGEQSPNPASRVTISGEVDALGMRRAVLNWQIDPVDAGNLYQTAMELARCVGGAGLGRMYVDMDPIDLLSNIEWCSHHIGTTRMHEDPRQGVVDPHCAVHGLSNFYIAGSSVFPTSGRANPTITIVALAIRLADHLKLTLKTS